MIQHSDAAGNRVLPNVPAVDTTLEVPPGGGEARLVDTSENTPMDGLHANWAAMYKVIKKKYALNIVFLDMSVSVYARPN